VIQDYVQHLMNVHPNDRYQTPAILLSDLRAVLPELRAAEATPAAPVPKSDDDDVPFCADDTDTALLGSDTSKDSVRILPGEIKPSTPTILCVEDRPKHQDSSGILHPPQLSCCCSPIRNELNRMASAPRCVCADRRRRGHATRIFHSVVARGNSARQSSSSWGKGDPRHRSL
jgi:hypothetical protein